MRSTSLPLPAVDTPPHSDALHDRDDLELVAAVRRGDTDAFARLWDRHRAAGLACSRATASSVDADDVVAEAFERIFVAIRAGGGPRTAFRAYLLTSIRNIARTWARAQRRTVPLTEVDDVAVDVEDEGESAELLHHAAEAFRSLSKRWQEALWCSEIEGMTTAEMSARFQLNANAISALTFRARAALRRAYADLGASEHGVGSRQAA